MNNGYKFISTFFTLPLLLCGITLILYLPPSEYSLLNYDYSQLDHRCVDLCNYPENFDKDLCTNDCLYSTYA